MKQTYNTHDIYALTTELVEWEGFRVLNVYDIDSKTICIKFNSHKSEKKYLVIESGTKFYTLDNFSATKDFPSSFCSKLRKHINNKRMESIKQVNLDRVVDIQFGTGELAYHVIGEFYASGNIIFTDHQYKILTLVHPYTYTISSSSSNESLLTNDEEQTKIKVNVGNIYPFEYATTNVELSIKSIKTMFEENLKQIQKKIKLKQFISKLPIIKYSPNVLEHAFITNCIEPGQKISSETKFTDIFESDEKVNCFINAINSLFELKKFTGYKTPENIYPYAYAHLNLTNSNNLIQYENFITCSSLFWSTLKPIETKEAVLKKNIEIKLSKQEKTIWNIEQQIKMMEKNINTLNDQIDLLTTHIDLIQTVFKSIESGNYVNFSQFDNEFFKINTIVSHKGNIKFELEGTEFELNYLESVFVGREGIFMKIKKINSKLTNAYNLLDKQKKTLSKSNNKNDNANANANPNAKEELVKNTSNKYIIIGQSKPNWFEQFNWFYTSDGLLFVSGKTAEQNEILVKRYMEDSDIYIHSDSFGSGSGLIKNPLKVDIPESNPKSLIESGIFLIAHTKAWETGTANSAYWVKPSQVSKTPESGEFVTKGSFIIRGQKNFIRVDRMELGFGIGFKVIGKEGFKGEVEKTEQIEYAIPILSTYSALNSYKFKVKIIPGTQKIKKALQDVLSAFMKKTTLYEGESIKKISNDSIQKVLINKIRFVMTK